MNNLSRDVVDSLNELENIKIISITHYNDRLIVLTPHQFFVILLVELNGKVYVNESDNWEFRFKDSSDKILVNNLSKELRLIKEKTFEQFKEINFYIDESLMTDLLVTYQKTSFDKTPSNHIYINSLLPKIKSIIVKNLTKKRVDLNTIDNLYKLYIKHFKIS